MTRFSVAPIELEYVSRVIKLKDNLRIIACSEGWEQAWPCADVPRWLWAEFDKDGNLVDISSNTEGCEPSGGLSEFLDDIYKEATKFSEAEMAEMMKWLRDKQTTHQTLVAIERLKRPR